MIFGNEKNGGIQPFGISPFFKEHLRWLLLNSNLILATQMLILAMQTKHFFHTLLTSTKIYRTLMRRNVALKASRATYLDQTQAIMKEIRVAKSFNCVCDLSHV